MSHSSLGRVAVVTSFAVLASGCAGGIFTTMNGYDAQSCAESALRRGDAAGVGREAFELFAKSCDAGDGGACSALGVTYERGIGAPANLPAAAAAFARACQLDNARGCTNLALLELARHPADPSVEALTRASLGAACDESDRLACARLGQLVRDGRGGPVNVGRAVDLFERACDAGETSACLDLAGAVTLSAPARALELYARACTAGEREACAALEASGQRGAPVAGVASR